MSNMDAVLMADGYIQLNGRMYSKGQALPACDKRVAKKLVAKGRAHWEYSAKGEIETDEAETDEPDTDEAETEEPEADVPGTDEPGTDEPNDEAEPDGPEDEPEEPSDDGPALPKIDAAAAVAAKPRGGRNPK